MLLFKTGVDQIMSSQGKGKGKCKCKTSGSSSSSSSMGGGGGGGGGRGLDLKAAAPVEHLAFVQSYVPLFCMPPVFAVHRDPEYLYGPVLWANRRLLKRIIQAIVRYLDPQSVMKLRMTTKEINREGERAMYRVWRYLVAVNFSSPFITLPEVGGAEGQMSFTRAVYHYFTRQRPQVVLIMGGQEDYVRDNHGDLIIDVTRNVSKMIIEQNDMIRFEVDTPMLHGRTYHNAVYNQGELFTIGSREGFNEQAVERLDTLTQAQTQLRIDLPANMKDVCAAMLDNKLYVISISKEVYTLEEHASEAAQGNWQKHEACTNNDRSLAAVIAFEGKLYLCGGYGDKSIEVFDPAVGTWQLEDEKMTKARDGFSMCVFEDEIYAVGGDEDGQNTTIEKMNKDTKRWELVTDCGQNRDGCAAALVGSKILLFGGGEHKSTFDIFDLHSKKWASQDEGGAYFDEPNIKQDEDEDEDEPVSKRQLPRQVYFSNAVHITPALTEKKKWTDLNVIKLEDRDTVRFDERFEATTGKAIAFRNPWDA